jgi:hypothetical protein
MRKKGMLIAIGLLILVNVIVLAGIAYNRSGEPETTIILTERELPVPYSGYANAENTGISLRIDWSRALYFDLFSIGKRWHNEKLNWFVKEKLEAIGFDCTLPLDDPGAEAHYQKMLPRKTYAVLEYEGETWKAWLGDARNDLADAEMQAQKGTITEEQIKNARKEFARKSITQSRLFVIDAATDLEALRRQYREPGRYMILPATVRLEYYASYKGGDKKKEPLRIEGTVSEILTDTIHVPKQYGAILGRLLKDNWPKQGMSGDYGGSRVRGPSYEVTIHIGKRAEPWIAAVRELPVETPK